MSFLIKDNELIAEVSDRKAGDVLFSYAKVEENINANREYNLINASYGKISNAKKWEKISKNRILDIAEEINDDEYYIY